MLKTTKICTERINFSKITTVFSRKLCFFQSIFWSCEFLFANLPTLKPPAGCIFVAGG